MPYGIRWGPPEAYYCGSCHWQYGDHYQRFCGICGAKQPGEFEVYEKGLVVSFPDGGREHTRDVEVMNAFLAEHVGKRIALWSYSVSHSELEFRLCHSGGPNLKGTPWLNTLIYCGGTEKLMIPVTRWNSNITISTGPISFGDGYALKDVGAGILVECATLRMYFDVKPGL
jgi:hypothetical protein